ncbi:MAG TPA: aminotransferase class IV [Anaerolineae bacterium]|nr:aminotransferase class IV [Anaerolineae bacterium]
MTRVYRFTHGQLQLTEQAGPTLDAVSLRLPNGAYTTLRTYDTDRVIGLSAHLQRLVESSQLLQRPSPIDLAAIRSALRDVIARERLPALRVRLTVPLDEDTIFISVEPFEVYPPELYQRGVRCATTRLARHTPRAKATDFIAASRESKAAIDPGIHELLMIDRQKKILEGTTSNFYAVFNGRLRTAGQDVLEGITRRIVLQEAAALLPIDYRPITVRDLPQIAEAFITSSSREVMPVIQIDDQIIGPGQPGSITLQLLEKYHAYLERNAERV